MKFEKWDDKENVGFSPEEEKFSKLLIRAIEEDEGYQKLIAEPLDLSFMDEKQPPELDEKRLHRSSHWKPKNFSRVAGLLVCFLIVAVGIGAFLVSEPAEALRLDLQRLFYTIRVELWGTDDAADDSQVTLEYKHIEDFAKAQKVEPQLCVPGYILEEYNLEALTLTKLSAGDFFANYTFVNEEKNTYRINIHKIGDMSQSELLGKGEITEYPDRIICVWTDESTDSYGATVILGDVVAIVKGDISKEEMLKIAEGLE